MARYYNAETLLEFVRQNVPHFDGETTMKCVERAIKEAPTADVVEVEILRDWLWEIALNNFGCVFDGDFSIACQDIISRLDGLRNFAKERRTDNDL